MAAQRLAIALGVAAALALPALAHADDETFEAKAQGAVHLKKLDTLVWALTATCDAGDDVQQRQCRQVRNARAAELSGATLLVDADSDALASTGWSPQKKSVPFSLSSCIKCSGIEVDGKTWFVTGTAAPHFEAGHLRGTSLHDNARTFGDEASGKAWARGLAHAQIELLVRVPPQPKWSIEGKNGIALEVLGFRAVNPCDGSIIAANPKASPIEPDKKACGAVKDEQVAHGDEHHGDDEHVADALSSTQVREGMRPVVDASKVCFDKFGQTGSSKLRITIDANGAVIRHELSGDFVGTPTGECIEKAVPLLAFPRSKKPQTTVGFPIVLR